MQLWTAFWNHSSKVILHAAAKSDQITTPVKNFQLLFRRMPKVMTITTGCNSSENQFQILTPIYSCLYLQTHVHALSPTDTHVQAHIYMHALTYTHADTHTYTHTCTRVNTNWHFSLSISHGIAILLLTWAFSMFVSLSEKWFWSLQNPYSLDNTCNVNTILSVCTYSL